MKPPTLPRLSAIASALFFVSFSPSAQAGNYKRITIDGDFTDWLGVPISLPDESGEPGQFDIRDVAIANDDDFLYVRIRLHTPSDYTGFHHQVIIDADADPGTGHPWVGLGSELLIEDGAPYQQKNGQFNEGAGSQLDWSAAPQGEIGQVELRISRQVLDAEGLNVFQDADGPISLSIAARDLEWQLSDSVDAISYDFAQKPGPFAGEITLVDYEQTFWFYQEVNDPDPGWLLPDYLGDETWKGSQGFFGFGLTAEDTYPEVTAPLTEGRTTYYFRAPFNWDFDVIGVALFLESYFSDGAVIYLNGDEVRRVRMPDGPIDGTTSATGDPAAVPEVFSLPASALIAGENLLMVEVHQAPESENQLAFGLQLRASDSVPPTLEEPDRPEDREVVEGQGTILTAGRIGGTEPFAFQWYKEDQPIDGANTARFEIPVVLLDDAGTYFVEVSNASGSVRSRVATLSTTAIPVSLSDETAPEDRSVDEGQPTAFEVVVNGSPLLAYQWYKDGEPIIGAVDATHVIEEAQLDDSGDYHVTITNRLNSVTSRAARLTVLEDVAGPAVSEVIGGGNDVVIQFSERLDPGTAADPLHYLVDGTAPVGASLGDDGSTVTLQTGQSLAFGEVFSLVIDDVQDLFGNSASATVPFRSTILIDGRFHDWTGVAPVVSDPKETDEGTEFKDFWVVNDETYLYLRFSFHREIGALPVDYFYQIFFDADNDPATGLTVGLIGSSMMIENGLGWIQRDGGFNEGSAGLTDFLLAPQSSSMEFECRVSLQSIVNADGSPVFTGDTVGLAFNLVSTSWTVVDSGPGDLMTYTLIDWPPLTEPPGRAEPLRLRRIGNQLEIQWDGNMALESSRTLRADSWETVPNAVASPYLADIDAGESSRFYRGRRSD